MSFSSYNMHNVSPEPGARIGLQFNILPDHNVIMLRFLCVIYIIWSIFSRCFFLCTSQPAYDNRLRKEVHANVSMRLAALKHIFLK